ncbi:MAG: hypothetical protein V4719_28855, partial [Planctomycetota bacterium]
PRPGLAERVLDAGAAGGEKQAQLVPDWVDASVPSNKVPLLNVRAGASVAAERQFGSLVEALKNLPSAGARIVLSHAVTPVSRNRARTSRVVWSSLKRLRERDLKFGSWLTANITNCLGST